MEGDESQGQGQLKKERSVDRAAALRRVKPPAIALMIVGIINGVFGSFVAVIGIFFGILGLGTHEGIIGLIISSGGLVTFFASKNLLRLENYKFVRVGIVIAMIPIVSICFLFGLPIGIWASVTASSPDVRSAFRT